MTHDLMTLTKLKDDCIVIGEGIGLRVSDRVRVRDRVRSGVRGRVRFRVSFRVRSRSHWVTSHESCYSDTRHNN